MPAIGAETVEDLAGELARRREHQYAAAFALRHPRILRKPMQDRQRESGGLAGAGLGDADDIAAAVMAIGTVCAWIGVGVSYFSSLSALMMASSRLKSLKLVNE
jgi:hypothetical protein